MAYSFFVKKLNMTPRLPMINPQLTAEDWELYTTSDRKEKSELAARDLNQHLEVCVAQNYTRSQTEASMLKFMDDWSDCGATDSEPRYVLQQLLSAIYDTRNDD